MHLSEAFERYRQDRIVFANRSAKTEESYIYTEKALIKYIGGDIALRDLTFQQLRSWSASMQKRGLVSGTIRGYIVNTRAVLNYMRILGEECLNPDLIVIPERVDPTPTFLTPEEVRLLIQVIKETQKCSPLIKARNMAIVSLIYSSGIRVAELCSLNKEDMLDEEVFTVLGKGRKRRPCMIDKRARKLLNEYLKLRVDGHQALFVENMNGERIKPGTIQALFRRLQKRFDAKAGTNKPIHPHTLRHSLANDLMRKGCHIYPLSRIMGHSNISTTQQYFQMFDPELLEVHKKYHTV